MNNLICSITREGNIMTV